jgi:DICT domain-containing protein
MHVSLYRSVQGQYDWMHDTKSVPMMNGISHLIEEQIWSQGIATDVYAGFQRFSQFLPQAERYRQLAEVARRVYVFGLPDVPPPTIAGVQFVPLRADSELVKEWFLLVDAADFWTALVAREVEGHDLMTGGRKFNGIWTFDVDLVNRISLLLSQVLERVYMPTVNRNYARQYEQIADINNQLMARLEKTRQVERRRWLQVSAIQQIAALLIRHRPLVRVNGYPLYLLHATCEALQTLYGVSATAIAYGFSGHNEYRQLITNGLIAEATEPLRDPQSASMRAITERRSVLIHDTRRGQCADPLVPRATTVLAVPIIGRTRVYGVLTIGGAEPDLWQEEDCQTLQIIATMIAGVIDEDEVRLREQVVMPERVQVLEQTLVKLRAPMNTLLDLQQRIAALGTLSPEQAELLTSMGRLTTHMSHALGGKSGS